MIGMRLFLPVILAVLFLSGCSEVQFGAHLAKGIGGSYVPPSSSSSPQQQGNFKVGNPYKVKGTWYYPKEQYQMTETGIASWYGPGFHGKKTANGEFFDKSELTAAHRTLQMPSLVRVTNLDNGRSVVVRINDRGPFKRGRIIDLSERAAELLEFKHVGTAKVKLEVMSDESLRLAQAAKQGGMPAGDTATYQTASLEPVQRETIVPGHMRNGAFYPEAVVSEMPVGTANIYIQAGSFTVQENAAGLSASLSTYAPANVHPAFVNGQQFFRVRLGPVSSVAAADTLLSRLVSGGHSEAIIVVD